MSGLRESRGPRATVGIVATVMAGLTPANVVAQECPCTVRVDTLAIIGGDFTGEGNLVGVYNPRRRLFYTSNFSWEDRVFVYEIPENGSRSLRNPAAQIGREGDGPGEFRRVVGMALMGDTLAVYDAQLERLSLFGPHHEFLHSFRTPGRGRLNVLVALGGHLVGEFVEPLRPDAPSLKVLDPANGAVIRTLDPPEPARSIGYALSISGARKLATNVEGTVFAAWRGGYEIRAYPKNDEPFVLMGDHPSFASRSYLDEMRPRDGQQSEAAAAQAPFEAVQEAIWVDPGTGWIGTVLYLPTGRPRSEPGAHARRIEFWDTHTREVRVSLSNAPPLEAHAGDGVLLGGDHDDDGNPLLMLFRIRVDTHRGTR